MKSKVIYLNRVRNYAHRYINGRHCKNLWDKIPDEVYDLVDYASADEDGYIIYLAPPFKYRGSSKIRAYSVKECIERLKEAEE